MVHPDYQYDPTLLASIIGSIEQGEADVVLGSRLMGLSPVKQGMPWWKYCGNRVLTKIENIVFARRLSDYHTGYRAYNRQVLETINFHSNSDNFIFDQELIAQVVAAGFTIAEVSIPTRYFPEASSASFLSSLNYGLGILWLMCRYLLHRAGLVRQKQFESLKLRYTKLTKAATN